MKKRSALICLLVAAILCLSSCSGSALPFGGNSLISPDEEYWSPGTETSHPLIYLILPSQEEPSMEEEAVISALAEETGCRLNIRYCNRDITAQTRAFSEAIEDNAALIVCDNLDDEATTRSAMAAKEAEIPVVLLGRGIDTMGVATTQVLTEYYSCMRMLAEQFLKENASKSEYLLLVSAGRGEDLGEAFVSSLTGHAGMHHLRTGVYEENDEQDAYDRIWELLRAFPDADTVVCYDSSAVTGTIGAAADLGRTVDILCLYADTDSIERGIQDGTVRAAVTKPATALARTAAQRILSYVTEGELPDSECVYVQGVLVEKETENDSE